VSPTIQEYFSQLVLPDPYSHKGQNGKLLIIGGSDLFHAASRWSLDVASKFVDMVFYSSTASNNQLMAEVKKEFWNGIVIDRPSVELYLDEADAVLIGPGMERATPALLQLSEAELSERLSQPPSIDEWNQNTELVVNYLLHKYPDKHWVLDAGALQMVVPSLLNENVVVTPHQNELDRLLNAVATQQKIPADDCFSWLLNKGVTILLKGPIDYVYHQKVVVEVTGGNPGMTKGGTGDVLAGIVAGLYSTNSAEVSAVVASYSNKKAGEVLAEKVGPFFNATDLVQVVPEVLWNELNKSS
jgi:NAD(P)H-hydrate epimerase